MKRKPIAVMSTDWHLNEANMEELVLIAEQEILLCESLDVSHVIWLGDMFDSRVSQTEKLLTCFGNILDMYHRVGIHIHCIPGNHDKTDYSSDDSFLNPFQWHPALSLHMEPDSGLIGGLACYFVPFYKTDVWLEKFSKLEGLGAGTSAILFSHTAIQGSINNDGSKVESSIKASLFKDFDKVFLGHYHNQQQPAKNVFHLPSVRQNNFGEDNQKGFTILYGDGTHKFVPSVFREYREVVVDAGNITSAEIKSLVKSLNTDTENVRVTITGDQQAVKGVDRKIFTDAGVQVKVKYSEVEVAEAEELEVVQELTGEDILEKFRAFCAEKGYDTEKGLTILNRIMKWEK